jgi:predicted nucleic acid-binding protein
VTAGIADTSVFIARESGRAFDASALPDDLAISIITIGELRAGVLAAVDVDTRDRRLATFSAAQALDPIPIDEPVADVWARLRIVMRDSGQRMPVNDSWIAATAISLGVAIVTQDDDYAEVPGLTVIRA